MPRCTASHSRPRRKRDRRRSRRTRADAGDKLPVMFTGWSAGRGCSRDAMAELRALRLARYRNATFFPRSAVLRSSPPGSSLTQTARQDLMLAALLRGWRLPPALAPASPALPLRQRAYWKQTIRVPSASAWKAPVSRALCRAVSAAAFERGDALRGGVTADRGIDGAAMDAVASVPANTVPTFEGTAPANDPLRCFSSAAEDGLPPCRGLIETRTP